MVASPSFQDAYGLPLSTRSATAVERYVAGVERLLAMNAGAEDCFEQAIAADEGFALAHAATALVWLPKGRLDEAKASAQRAVALAGGLSRREQQHVEVVAQVVGSPPLVALDHIRAHLAEFPRDAVILRQAMNLLLISGGPTKKQDSLRLLNLVEPHYVDDWFFLGTSALTYQDLDLFDEARRRSERALALYPRSANAAHSLGHVYFETSDHAGGAAFVRDWIVDYDRRAPLHCHLSWHLVLFELASGHYSRVLELYERDIRPALLEVRNGFYDAVALLWRYQIYGCATGPLPWQDLSERAAQLTVRPGLAFNDVHAAFAFAAAGDDAALGRLIDGLRDLAAQGHPVAGTVVLPLAQGIQAFVRGDYDETVRLIAPTADQIVGVGGSNAQREVIEDTLVEACLRAGRFEEAERLLRKRLGRRPSARDFFWLGRAQVGRGRGDEAEASLSEARTRWSSADPDSPELAVLQRLVPRGQ